MNNQNHHMHKLLVSLKLALKNLRSNISRTLLSLLGIVIGVASVILVLSLGSGVKQFLVDQVSAFGTDIFQIEIKVPKTDKTSAQNAGGMVGGTQITTFKLEDAKKVAKLTNVDSWYAAIMTQQIVNYSGKNKQAFIMGVTAGVVQADPKTEISSGVMFSEEDDNNLRRVAVLGNGIKESFFGNEEAVGKEIKIKGQTYRVIGVLKKRGLMGFFNFDDTVYAPLQTVQKKLAGTNHLQFAIYKMKDARQLELNIAQATDIMRTQHKIANPNDNDFAVNSIKEVLDILNKVFFAVNAMLLALTSISLLVGGVGIMNVMYVSVTERTYEIGLKKSVGAKNSSILAQFLFEAVFLTIMGGVAGLLAGFLISRLAGFLATSFGYAIPFVVTSWSAAIGIGFSALTGIVFGYYPARTASRLTPVEALRRE